MLQWIQLVYALKALELLGKCGAADYSSPSPINSLEENFSLFFVGVFAVSILAIGLMLKLKVLPAINKEFEYRWYAERIHGEHKSDHVVQNFKTLNKTMPTKKQLIETFRLLNIGSNGQFVKLLHLSRTNPTCQIDLSKFAIKNTGQEGVAYCHIFTESDDYSFRDFYAFIVINSDVPTSLKNLIKGLMSSEGSSDRKLTYVGQTSKTEYIRAWVSGGHFNHGTKTSGGSPNLSQIYKW